MKWREYHEFTKHSVESLRRTAHVLDWANMPDPFRHYEGVPVLDLPADPPAPETRTGDGATFLSQLLFYSAAISASKVVPSTGYRYALRVNPSSGNLHPTEFHFLARGLKDWPDGLYHYRPSAHMAEQRALGDLHMNWSDGTAPITFVLTSIAWREAWKYRDRAYRYCMHDIGHAWQALALAARAMGCETFARAHFPDDEVARSCRLYDDEWPMLIIEVRGESVPVGERHASEPVWFAGEGNQISKEVLPYARIDEIHRATKYLSHAIAVSEPARTGRGEIRLPPPVSSNRPFGEVVRTRRSALDFVGGTRSISLAQLSAILASATESLSADFASTRFVQLYLYVHRVVGLEPGVYRLWPDTAELEQIKIGDQRVQAAGLSLGQELAGNACVAFSMMADIENAVRAHGDRGYRYVHFEAGAIGQRLNIAAEMSGLRATGIGAFYDDRVHDYLDIARPGDRQVVYHFAIGHPVDDPRVEA
jgi:SagB-type dehydrogenase family enzyme